MSTIEKRCADCGHEEIVSFTFHGLQPPAVEDDCPRCLHPLLTSVRFDKAELGDDTRPVPRPDGAVIQVAEGVEALQREILRLMLPHLKDASPPEWDRRLTVPTESDVLHVRAFRDAAEGIEAAELFAPLSAPTTASPSLLAACHALGQALEGDVVLCRSDLDLTRPADADAPAVPFYRHLLDPASLQAEDFDSQLALARGEAHAARVVVREAVAGEAAHHDKDRDLIDEARVGIPEIRPLADPREPADVAEVRGLVRRFLGRVGVIVPDGDEDRALAFAHGSALVHVETEQVGKHVFTRIWSRLACAVDRGAVLPYLVDFNRAEDMGRFLLHTDGTVIFEHVLLADDLDATELLKALAYVAEVADDRDDVIVEFGKGERPEDGPTEGSELDPLFATLSGEGLLEDVPISAEEAGERADGYLRSLGLIASMDSQGIRWVHSGSSQIGLSTRSFGPGAIAVFEAPVLHEVEASADLPGVLNDLNLGVAGGAFTYDAGVGTIWFREALYAADMDRGEFAWALLHVAQTADESDDALVTRIGGRRTLDVVGESLARLADAALELRLSDLREGEREVRRAAARSLAQYSGSRVVDALVAAMVDANEEVAHAALRALLAVPAGSDRQAVLGALCGVAAAAGYPAHSRRFALVGLELLGEPAALTAVRTALGDQDAMVRARAARTLGRLAKAGHHDAEGGRLLVALLDDRDPWVLLEVLGSLPHCVAEGDDAGRAEVVGLISAILDDAPANVRSVAFEALSHLGDQGAGAAAALAGADDPEVMAGVARVLRRAGTAEHMSALLGLTSADSAEVREDAVAGLARVGGADGHTALLGILRNDPDVDVRRVALEVLVAAPGAQDDEALREALGSAAKSDDSAIREDANWGMRVLLEEIPEPPTTDAAREVRRLLGASLEWLLRDLDDDSRTTLLAGGAPAAEAAGACLAKIAAAGGRYPGYAFALVRLVGRFGSDTARSALSELAGGTTALAAAARARSG